MTEQEYNMAEGVRRSDLWKMADSPEKFKYFSEHPVEQTPAMAFGSAAHKVVLEPTDFNSEFAVAPNVDRRTKAGKEEWEAFQEVNGGKTILSGDDWETIQQMIVALSGCPLAKKLIFGNGQSEIPIFWTDPETGERCKAKLDRVTVDDDGQYMIVDYKTAACAETERFNNEIFKLGYHFQAGFYTDGLMNVLGLDYRPRFVLVVQEKKAPYAVNVIEITEDVMKVGVNKFHELLEKYHNCKAVDMWPGYIDDDELPNEAYIPGWVGFEEAE